MKIAQLLPVTFAGALLAACSSAPTWDGEVETYGTLHEVLRQGQHQGRVVVGAAAVPHAVGLGALAGLGGEVVIFEGQMYTGRVESDRVVSDRGTERDEAAFLAVAKVPEWVELRIARSLVLDNLALLLEEIASENALATYDTFPFVIEGELLNLKSHVIDGNCPIANPDGPEPARQTAGRAQGRLVGFYTTLPPGTLTHHGSPLHIHVVLAGKKPLVAHVDDVTITAGSKLLVPKP